MGNEHENDPSRGEPTLELVRRLDPGPFRVRARTSGGERGRTLRRGQSFTIGSGDEADLTVADPTVSSVHCRIEATASGVEVTDLSSKNGLWVGGGRVGRALLAGQKVEFSIGATSVRVESSEPTEVGSLGLIGVSDSMARVREKILRYAGLVAPVLVVGESGTGKDLVARALHECSRRSGAYVPLNAAALPESLFDSELFGHARGAFTGAVGSRVGAFELSHRGTLFLDEIAEMSLQGQAKLLRVVEDGKVRPVGASQSTAVETRIVSATCAPLEERIRGGQFRHDLFHRLSTLIIEVPPLRRRTVDIPHLARSFFERRAGELGHKELSPEAIEFLARHGWPGNVRQLFGVLYRAAVFAESEILRPSHFELAEERAPRARTFSPERARELLEQCGSVSAAARVAGLPRSSFRSILRRAVTATEGATGPAAEEIGRSGAPE